MSEKPRVLVLGGVGFIGRNFVEYLAKNQLCSKIAVCDKVLPETAGLSAEQLKLFKEREDLVVYKQINLAREGNVVVSTQKKILEKLFKQTDEKIHFLVSILGAIKVSHRRLTLLLSLLSHYQKCF
jgi:dTDP-D-glucose 4,6-dehydratase